MTAEVASPIDIAAAERSIRASNCGGCVWEISASEIDSEALPASARPKATPRPPKWEAAQGASYGRGSRRAVVAAARPGASKEPAAQSSRGPTSMSPKRLQAFKDKQLETLENFRAAEASGSWDRIHRGHFDWWMFPIDDGSKPDFNVGSEADIEALRSDEEWHARYLEAVRLVAAAWGWDAITSTRIDPPSPGMGYRGWDVRLAKVCRSLYLLEEEQLLASMQSFAREVQRVEKEGKSFFYGRICLDELLYFELPRRPQAAQSAEASPP